MERQQSVGQLPDLPRDGRQAWRKQHVDATVLRKRTKDWQGRQQRRGSRRLSLQGRWPNEAVFQHHHIDGPASSSDQLLLEDGVGVAVVVAALE